MASDRREWTGGPPDDSWCVEVEPFRFGLAEGMVVSLAVTTDNAGDGLAPLSPRVAREVAAALAAAADEVEAERGE